jgi:hypothetical protein
MTGTLLRRARRLAAIGLTSAAVFGASACQGGGVDAIVVGSCTVSRPQIAAPSGLLQTTATANCTETKTRTLRAEIKWDHNVLPDPLVASNSDSGTKTAYSKRLTTCDNGNIRAYYGRAFFSSGENSNAVDSVHQVLEACG